MGQQARRGEATIRHAHGRWRHDRRQRAIGDPDVFGPHRFAPEELAGLVIQEPADFLADAFPLIRLGLDDLRLDHFAHHLQVVRGAKALRIGPRPPGRAGHGHRHGRRRSFERGLHQTTQEQLQLSRVQLLALLAEEPPGQRIQLLTQ